MSFCDGASQDDAGEVVSKQCVDVLSSQDVEKQTGKSQLHYIF
jgi:serine/threonine protein phosphatase PrpC